MANRYIVVATLAVLLSSAFALPQEAYENQRICWKQGDCIARPTTVNFPGGSYYPSDGSFANPIPFGTNSLIPVFTNPPTFPPQILNINTFTDQYRLYGILSRDDIDYGVLNYDHTITNRSTAEVLLSHLLVLGTEQTENVNVVWAIFGDASLPATVDGTKAVDENVIRSRVVDSGEAIPSSLRLLGSAKLSTLGRTPDYATLEQNLNYYAPVGFTSGCVGFMPPFSYEGCDYTNGVKVNPNKVALPASGTLYYVLYEEKGRPTPYVLSTGSHSLLNYMSFFGPPQAPFNGADAFILGQNFQNLLDIGSIIYDGADLATEFTAVH